MTNRDRTGTTRSADDADDSPRQRRIMRAAEELFKRSGFRGTTMEAIAREAAVSKATLYSRFANKDEVFREVCERMARLLRRTFDDALAADGTVDERVTAAVVGKHRLAFTLVRTSPHAADLFSHKAQLAGDVFTEADEAMVQHLARALRADAALAPAARRLARALFYGSVELAERCATVSQMEAEITAFVTVHLAGARALTPKDPDGRRRRR